MLKTNEFKIGNLVYYGEEIFTINSIEIERIGLNEHKYWEYFAIDEIKPIPLTEEWLLKIPKKIKYPKWIKNLHDLQNWYYYTNNKKELKFK